MPKLKHGLTLLEVMLSIFIFGVGILGVLQIMTQNIGLIDRTKLKAEATFLAKEGIELAFHHRNTNVLLGYNRQCEERDNNTTNQYGCTNLLGSGNTSYLIGPEYDGSYFLQAQAVTGTFNDQLISTLLYQKSYENDNGTVTMYSHDDTGRETFFGRYIEFEPLKENSISDNLKNKLIKVTSTTLYSKGSTTGSVILESILGERN